MHAHIYIFLKRSTLVVVIPFNLSTEEAEAGRSVFEASLLYIVKSRSVSKSQKTKTKNLLYKKKKKSQ